jgi:hypothetical protein
MSLDEWRQRPTGNLDAHPDDLEKLKAFQDRGSSSYELELRLRKGDGSFRLPRVRLKPGENSRMRMLTLQEEGDIPNGRNGLG